MVKIDATGWWTYAHDHLGTTSLMAAWDGTVASTTTHLPFGAIEAETGTQDEPYKFTGKELERDFGIYYFGARYYNPHLVRWISVDPIILTEGEEHDYKPYSYALNSPYNFEDPDGAKAFNRVWKAIKKGYRATRKWVSDKMRQTPVDAADKQVRKSTQQKAQELKGAKEQIAQGARASKFTQWYAKNVGRAMAVGGAVGLATLGAIKAPAAAAALKEGGRELARKGVAALTSRFPFLGKAFGKSAGGAAGAEGARKGAEKAQQAVDTIDPNKLHHIFGKASHNLDPLVQKIGPPETVYRAVESATQTAVQSQSLSEVFTTTIKVAGQDVVVRGRVIEGVAKIGSFWIE